MLAAARTLAARDGVRSVTLAAVTSTAGLHPSAVRRYFTCKEELLLELAEQEWQSWSQAVAARLEDRVDQSPGVLADVLVETVVAQPLFCDLSCHVVLWLEDGVSQDRVRTYKERAFAAHDRIVATLVSASTLTIDGARDTLASVLALVSYLWQVAHPGPALAAVYADTPRWGHTATHFEAELKRLLRQIITGVASGH
jgi:AcrR family transcriptional regulator